MEIDVYEFTSQKGSKERIFVKKGTDLAKLIASKPKLLDSDSDAELPNNIEYYTEVSTVSSQDKDYLNNPKTLSNLEEGGAYILGNSSYALEPRINGLERKKLS